MDEGDMYESEVYVSLSYLKTISTPFGLLNIVYLSPPQ